MLPVQPAPNRFREQRFNYSEVIRRMFTRMGLVTSTTRILNECIREGFMVSETLINSIRRDLQGVPANV